MSLPVPDPAPERRSLRLAAMLDRVLDWLAHLRRERNGEGSLRESLEEVIEEHEEDGEAPISPDERLMLLNILSLGEISADDVMIPRADIVAVEVDTPFDELVRVFRDASHSRLPVYRKTLDDVLGMVHIKDVLAALADAPVKGPPVLRDICRPTLFVPPSMPVLDLLRKMRLAHIHMALVVDEYGGTDGLITIEDLVEEIVGEIEDEHDTGVEPRVVPRPGGGYEADARAPIAALEAQLKLDLLDEERDEDIDTLGGLVVALAGRVPDRGEVVTHPAGIEFEVVDADPRRIKRLRIRRVAD